MFPSNQPECDRVDDFYCAYGKKWNKTFGAKTKEKFSTQSIAT